MVMFEVRPVFHGLTASVTRQTAVPGVVTLGLGLADVTLGLGLADVMLGLGLADVTLGLGLGLADVTLGLGLGLVLWNCAKKANTAAEVQVRVPLVAVDPSTGSGVWSPSNAAHWTGYPARHPE